jgi:hypothetical protein
MAESDDVADPPVVRMVKEELRMAPTTAVQVNVCRTVRTVPAMDLPLAAVLSMSCRVCCVSPSAPFFVTCVCPYA